MGALVHSHQNESIGNAFKMVFAYLYIYSTELSTGDLNTYIERKGESACGMKNVGGQKSHSDCERD